MKKLIRFLLALIVVLTVAFTIFWFARPADVNFDEARGAVPNAAYSHFANIDDVRIHYQEKGSGAALFFYRCGTPRDLPSFPTRRSSAQTAVVSTAPIACRTL